MAVLLALMGHQLQVAAETASVPSLIISQLKLTSSNGQFVTLYNTTDATLDLSKYQLEYFNNYDLAKATSSRLIPLAGLVPPHGYFMANDGPLLLCYQLTVDSVSLGLSTTAGLVSVVGFNQVKPGAPITPLLNDYAAWSKTATTGAQTLPAGTNASLLRQPLTPQANPAVSTPGAGSWQTVQPDATDSCRLLSNGAPVQLGLTALLATGEPPVMITDSETSESSDSPTINGLTTPRITELLPNPAGTGNDTTNEFIELYNANSVPFDLSGFKLQSGLTTLHDYTFPVGTSLPARAFVAFYAPVTGLSLSNSSGQVKLLDPAAKVLSVSDVYGSAKDGQAWALANGKWYWTTTVTPAAANIIKQPAAAKKSAAVTKTAAAKPAAKVKSAKTTKSAVPKQTAALPVKDAPVPLHVRTLALVGAAALLYGTYEYRTDLANRIHQLRGYFRYRGSGGTPT
jgi:hypothetical protein